VVFQRAARDAIRKEYGDHIFPFGPQATDTAKDHIIDAIDNDEERVEHIGGVAIPPETDQTGYENIDPKGDADHKPKTRATGGRKRDRKGKVITKVELVNPKLALWLEKTPYSSVRDCVDKFGTSEGTIRRCPAWKANRRRLKEAGEIAVPRPEAITDRTLGMVASGDVTPDQYSENKEELDRLIKEGELPGITEEHSCDMARSIQFQELLELAVKSAKDKEHQEGKNPPKVFPEL
jgi:hypothetical protein